MYFIEKTKGLQFFKRFDYLLFLPVFLLTMFGLLVLKSATLTRVDGGMKIMIMQLIGLGIGLILAFIISSVDYKDLKTLSIILYSVSILLLILVLLVGTGEQYGSRSWLKAGIFSFQPSEITKITFIIIVAMYLEKLKEGVGNRDKNVLKLILYCFVPIALIIAQKDYGTTMVFLFILLVMLVAYGIKLKALLLTSFGLLLTTPLLWIFVLNDKRRERILTFLDPERDPLGSGYNVLRSKMTVGSGRISGKGIFQGVQTQNSSVPVKESDFIFSVIGEELGFIGVVFILLLISIIMIRCLYVAMYARDNFGSFLVIGVSAMLGIHFIENIGMSIGLLPVTGIPLPFVSAGGSALVSNYVAVGIVMSVALRRQKVIFNS